MVALHGFPLDWNLWPIDEWPARLDLHKQLAAAEGFEAGQTWLAAHPVPQETCYQYFKEALLVWTFTRSQAWFLEKSVRMNCVAPGPVATTRDEPS